VECDCDSGWPSASSTNARIFQYNDEILNVILRIHYKKKTEKEFYMPVLLHFSKKGIYLNLSESVQV
jgi:hypothetical protein